MATSPFSDCNLLADKPPRRRRWIPLSLRMFAAMLALLGIAACWQLVTAYQQWHAIREIERLGIRVIAIPVGPWWLRDFAGEETMSGFDEVISLDATTGCSDAMLAHMNRFKNLQTLWLRDTQVTDAGLAHLGCLRNLVWLNLSHTKVSADGLATLATQPNLKILWLDDSQVSDAGRHQISQLAGLKWLVIENRAKTGRLGGRFSELDSLQIRALELMWQTPDISDMDDWLIEMQPDNKLFMPQLTVTKLDPRDQNRVF